MGEAQVFFLRLAVGFVAALLLGVVCFLLARKKGRDTVGWFFNGFLPGLVGSLIVAFALPGHPVWAACGVLVDALMPGLVLGLKPLAPQGPGGERVRRPLRRFYLYLFLIVALLLIVFGFIGYYCVPDQPQNVWLPAGVIAA